MTNSEIILMAALVLFAPFAATAKDDSLPKLDIERLCRDRANSMAGLRVGLGDSIDQCVRDEEKARDALTAAWKNIPPSYKANCVHPNEYAASYYEWIRCLELNIDVKNLRSQQ